METLSHLKKLDIILNFLEKNYDRFGTIVTYNSIDDYCKGKISKSEIYLIIKKLMKDGYAEPDPDGLHATAFKITFEGLVLVEIGGYQQQQIITETNERVALRNDILLVRGTWFAGFAAIALLLWQVWIWLYPVHTNYPYWIWETILKRH